MQRLTIHALKKKPWVFKELKIAGPWLNAVIDNDIFNWIAQVAHNS